MIHKLFSKDELKLLWPFYLEALVGTSLLVFIPFMVLYFNSIGLTFTQIGLIYAALPLASLIFEIPTSSFADLYGRKASVIFGWMMQSIMMILIYFTTNFYALFLLFLLFGTSQTFVSGSYEAWVVDLLNEKKKNKLVQTYFAKKHSLMNAGFVLSGIIGAFLVSQIGLKIIWPISAIAMALSFSFLFFGEEKYKKRKTEIKEAFKSLFKQTKNSISYGYKHQVLFYLFIIVFIIGIISSLNGLTVWTSLLKSHSLADESFGYIWSISALIGIIAPIISSKLTKNGKEKLTLISIMFLFMIYSLGVLFINNIVLLITFFFINFFLIDSYVPIWNTYFHRHSPKIMRATLGGIQGIVVSISGIIGLPLAGFLVDYFSAKQAIFISGLLFIPIILLFIKIKEKK